MIVINKIKNDTVPGDDDVVAELIKYRGSTTVEAMYKLIVMVWDTEIMPEGWTTGIICPIFLKKKKKVTN